MITEIKELKKEIKNMKKQNHKKIMYIIINIYEKECEYDEGCIGFSDLVEIYKILKEEKK